MIAGAERRDDDRRGSGGVQRGRFDCRGAVPEGDGACGHTSGRGHGAHCGRQRHRLPDCRGIGRRGQGGGGRGPDEDLSDHRKQVGLDGVDA